ncbi:MAG TPA: thioredoxin domain-containing protein [Candidatus Paceibacterota bacterium]|nr:thioredoxin domain-containing protein [Candidatus Paceibacterota bacterium]
MNRNYALPITIVVAGVLIAGAVFWAGRSSTTTPTNTDNPQDVRTYAPGQDHILGNPDAAVKVVEYMDLECPHCKLFNTTMHQVMDYYGTSGKVAWVQRPFPLGSIHSKAPKEAEAAECAADQGGDKAYFAYTDAIFDITPSDNGLDLAQLPIIAKNIGLNVDTFNSCLSSGKFTKKVTDSYNEAIKAGGQGTPYTLIMVGTDSVALSGAQPYNSMRAAIDAVLSSLPGGASVGASASTTTQ